MDSTPQPLATVELVDLAAELAAEVDLSHWTGEADERTWSSLGEGPEWNAWLELWPGGGGIELHDHGGSAAAVAVVAGRLVEAWAVAKGRRLSRRRLESGTVVWLPPSHVHDIVNVDVQPALSVHVYSPALTSMTFYRRTEDGLAVERTDRVGVRV
jgi:hypothetical protein